MTPGVPDPRSDTLRARWPQRLLGWADLVTCELTSCCYLWPAAALLCTIHLRILSFLLLLWRLWIRSAPFVCFTSDVRRHQNTTRSSFSSKLCWMNSVQTICVSDCMKSFQAILQINDSIIRLWHSFLQIIIIIKDEQRKIVIALLS